MADVSGLRWRVTRQAGAPSDRTAVPAGPPMAVLCALVVSVHVDRVHERIGSQGRSSASNSAQSLPLGGIRPQPRDTHVLTLDCGWHGFARHSRNVRDRRTSAGGDDPGRLRGMTLVTADRIESRGWIFRRQDEKCNQLVRLIQKQVAQAFLLPRIHSHATATSRTKINNAASPSPTTCTLCNRMLRSPMPPTDMMHD